MKLFRFIGAKELSRIIISKTDKGVTIYDEVKKDRIDLFPKEEGYIKRAIEFIKAALKNNEEK